MKDSFPAHIRADQEQQEIQSVAEHCVNTARYAGDALKGVGLAKSGYLIGLVHDAGKAKAEFKEYIERAAAGEPVKRGSVNHTFAGVRLLLERYHSCVGSVEAFVSELLAYAVGAHHGLFDCIDEKQGCGFRNRMEKDKIGYEESRENFYDRCADEGELDKLFTESVGEIFRCFDRITPISGQSGSRFTFYTGLLVRLLLSALIEGDRRDTAEFMERVQYPENPEDMRPIWKGRLAHLEEKLNSFSQEKPISRARREISDQCRARAEWPGGVYRLNVPTGAGKTLSGLRFALAHGAKWNKRRIIFTAPLLTILDQNAQVIRDFVGDDSLILEHHSNVIRTRNEGEALEPWELLAENWESPIIITTMVQLLNTLFSGKTTSIRRFHALCNSVIVIDEVQTVPNKLLSLFNLAVNFLSGVCGTTFVLCSATQPCLAEVNQPLLREPEDLVPFREELWQVFKRTEIQSGGGKRLEELPDYAREILAGTSSLLIVCNKKAEAEELFASLQEGDHRCFHLSAAMCVAHRRAVLAELEQALEESRKGGKKVICVSTQVIEAGVDISFGRVIRLNAGMDSVIQSAGRCNRNGEESQPAGVYIVECLGEKLGMLPEIKLGQQATTALLNRYGKSPEQFRGDLSSDEAIRFYYRNLYGKMAEGYQDFTVKEPKCTLLDLLSLNTAFADENCPDVSSYSLWQAFALAGRKFEVFDTETTDVLVPYGEGKALIEEIYANQERLRYDFSYARSVIERAKGYTVSLYEYTVRELDGMLEPVCDGRLLVATDAHYDENTGFTLKKASSGYMGV